MVETIRLMAGLKDDEVEKLRAGLEAILKRRDEAQRLGVVFEGGKVGCKMQNFVAVGVK